MAVLIDCNLDAKTIVSLLGEKLSDLRWKLGDSEYEGFYILGRSENGIRVKITEETEANGSTPSASGRGVPRRYHLGFHFFVSKENLGRFRKLLTTMLLQRRVRRVIAAGAGS